MSRERMCHFANCHKYVDMNDGGVSVNYRNEERMAFCCVSHAALILTSMASRKEFARTVKKEYKRMQTRRATL